MTAPFDLAAARAEWLDVAENGFPSEIADTAGRLIPGLLDHVEVLHRAIRRAATDPDIGHGIAYVTTILDEVTV